MSKSKNIDNKILYQNSKWKDIWKRINRIIFGSTIPQKMFRFYFLVIIVGAILLYMPFTHWNNELVKYTSLGDPLENSGTNFTGANGTFTFWDALFASCSAFSDTGFTTSIMFKTYNIAGQVVILILVQLGGLGFITLIFFIWNAFRRTDKTDINQTIMLQAERGNEKLGNTYKSIKYSVIIVLVIELSFAFIYSFWLCYMPAYHQLQPENGLITYDNLNMPVYYYHDYARSLWNGIFVSVCSLNNAGFDILGSFSLSSYRNDANIFFQFLVMIQFVVGGLGFPLIFDVIEAIKHRKHGLRYRLSLFTKVCGWTYLVVTIIGLVASFSIEYIDAWRNPENLDCIVNNLNANGEFGKNEWLNKNFTIFFNAMSTRSAGFATIDMNAMSLGCQWIFIVLMFIGASPSSAAGGIRNTTLAVVCAAIWARITGKNNVNLFKKRIPDECVKNSFIVLAISVGLVLIGTIIVFYTHTSPNSSDLTRTLFDVASCFGTCGLTVGTAFDLHWVGLIVLIILMFIGQLGVSSTLLSWTKKKPKGNLIEYPSESIRIG